MSKKFFCIALLTIILLAFTACGTDEPQTVAPRNATEVTTQNTVQNVPQDNAENTPQNVENIPHANIEHINPQQPYTAYVFRHTISSDYFIDNANNLRERNGGAIVLGDVEEILDSSEGFIWVRYTNGIVGVFRLYNGGRNMEEVTEKNYPVEDWEIQDFANGRYLLDTQGRLWDLGWYFEFDRPALSEDEVVPAPTVIMENVVTIQQGYNATLHIHTSDGNSYVFNPYSYNLAIYYPEVSDNISDEPVIFADRNLIDVRIGGNSDRPIRIELDIYGNVHTSGWAAIGDGHGSTDMARRANNVLSNVIQVGTFNNYFVALTSDGNLYFWGGSNILTPTRILENVAYFNIRHPNINRYDLYALFNSGELYEVKNLYQSSDWLAEEVTTELSLLDVKIPQRRIIGQ